MLIHDSIGILMLASDLRESSIVGGEDKRKVEGRFPRHRGMHQPHKSMGFRHMTSVYARNYRRSSSFVDHEERLLAILLAKHVKIVTTRTSGNPESRRDGQRY